MELSHHSLNAPAKPSLHRLFFQVVVGKMMVTKKKTKTMTMRAMTGKKRMSSRSGVRALSRSGNGVLLR